MAQYFPPGQSKQSVSITAPVVGRYVPAGHGVGVWVPVGQ